MHDATIPILLLQPEIGADFPEEESDSESEDEDVFDSPTPSLQVKNTEHSDPNSYSWLVLKLATLRVVQTRLTDFLAVSGKWFSKR